MILEVFLVQPKFLGVVLEVETELGKVVLLVVLLVFFGPMLVISKALLAGLLVVAVQQFSAVKK